ncbi:MAG TPA: response regulator [Steroidobacteraceae bacterium]|nr:response regulator [Steroidobacteraceae bacterium]
MSKKILIVDDSSAVRTIVRKALREAGYEVIEASNGLEALAIIGADRIHLVVSDLIMPVMDGMGLLEAVRRHPTGHVTPVIMLSTVTAQEQKEAARAAGARAWFSKPFQPSMLIEAISRLVTA